MDNTDPNSQTIKVYDEEYQKYLAHTPSRHPQSQTMMLKWIETALSYAKDGGAVLEIGSATPRDALFIRSKGYTVQCSDAAPSFVDHMNSLGESAIVLNVLKDTISQKYDMVFANAVFPHFTDDEIRIALSNIRQALNTNGIVCFNVKQGDGDTWIEEKTISKRFINFQSPESIKNIVEQSGFEVVVSESDQPGGLPSHIWTRIIARKAE